MYTGFEPSERVNVDPSLSTSEKSGAVGPSTPDGDASGSDGESPVVSVDPAGVAVSAGRVVTAPANGSTALDTSVAAPPQAVAAKTTATNRLTDRFMEPVWNKSASTST